MNKPKYEVDNLLERCWCPMGKLICSDWLIKVHLNLVIDWINPSRMPGSFVNH